MTDYKSLSGIDLLRELSLAFGPSGCEGNVADIIKENIAPYADEVLTDRMGSVIALYKGTGEGSDNVTRLMLSAHMDEVGFMIKSIDGDGYLKMTPLSGRDPKTLVGRNVTIGDETRKTNGYIGVKPAHLGGSGNYDSLYVDIGAKNKEDAEAHVKVGDFGTYRSDFVRFGKDGAVIKGKALDDRLGCTVLCETLRRLSTSGTRLPYDIYFAFTCREEIGSSGALTAANKIKPDAAIVFEATAVADVDGVEKNSRVAEQGRGGCISFMDKGTIYNEELYQLILETGKKNNIPCQPKQYIAGGNDAGHIHKSKAGVRCAVISAPARYIHTSSNVVRESDFWAICDLIQAVLKELI